MRKKLLVLLVAVLSAPFSSWAQINVFEGSLEQLLKHAGQSDKKALVMVSTTWCAPCKMFMKVMVPKPEMGEYVNSRFVFGHYDIDKEDPEGLGNRYGVSAFPTFLVLDSDGEEVGRTVGAVPDVAKMIAALESACDSPIARMKKEFATDPVGKAEDYIKALRDEYRSDDIQDVLDELCGVMEPSEVISKYMDDIRMDGPDDFDRPLARAIAQTDSLYARYAMILEMPISNMATVLMNHLGENRAEDLSVLRSAIESHGRFASEFARFVGENGEAVIKGDVPALLDQIRRKDVYSPAARVSAIFTLVSKSKSNNTMAVYVDQFRSVLESLNSEEGSDKRLVKNILQYMQPPARVQNQ